MPIIEVLPMNVNEETNDAPKKFTNVDSEDFEFTYMGDEGRTYKYVVKAGETVTLPKYIVNFACTHLGRKIVKRELRAKAVAEGKKLEKDEYPTRNEEMEKELHIKMIAEELPKKQQEDFRCNICGFEAKSKFGLDSHKRKHK